MAPASEPARVTENPGWNRSLKKRWLVVVEVALYETDDITQAHEFAEKEQSRRLANPDLYVSEWVER